MRESGHRAPSTTMRRGSRGALAILALAVLVAVGCQLQVGAGAYSSNSASTAPETPAQAQPTAASPAAGDYPLALEDDEGTSVTLAAQPMRIVSLTPATTETVFALGAGDRLVGRTDADDYPPAAADVESVAAYTGVDIEKVVAVDPDLVLAGGNGFTAAADIARLRQLGFPVLVVYAPTVEGVLADIGLVGRAIGAQAQADGLVASMRERITAVESAVAGLDRPRVFYEIGYQPQIYGPAPDSFPADMLTLAGSVPITTTDPSVFSISLERLVSLDPQLIVLGDAPYGTCPADVAARPGWETMTAVRAGDIEPVDDTVVTRPGPRLAEGLAALALAIHPDATISPPTGATDYCLSATPSP
jgi:iron complex transport system substrate-binding protein